MRVFPALGVLAGGDHPSAQLSRLAALSEFVAAADGAADRLLAAGIVPDLTVGDLDSLRAPSAALREVLRVADQDSTDADKLLAALGERGRTRIVLAGAEGDLPDHFLASLQSAAKADAEIWFALRRGVGRILRSGDAARLVSRPGSRVSLIPIAPCEGVVTDGLRWRVADGRLDPLGPSGISNRATDEEISVGLEAGALFLFAEADEPIDALVSSFGRS